jgi:GTPase Era involved in 16S rRNA processing
MSRLSVAFEEYAIILADTPVAVEESTDLSSSLQKLYASTLKSFEDINKLLSNLESTSFLEEILASAAELRRTWANLKLTLTNQVVCRQCSRYAKKPEPTR